MRSFFPCLKLCNSRKWDRRGWKIMPGPSYRLIWVSLSSWTTFLAGSDRFVWQKQGENPVMYKEMRSFFPCLKLCNSRKRDRRGWKIMTGPSYRLVWVTLSFWTPFLAGSDRFVWQKQGENSVMHTKKWGTFSNVSGSVLVENEKGEAEKSFQILHTG